VGEKLAITSKAYLSRYLSGFTMEGNGQKLYDYLTSLIDGDIEKNPNILDEVVIEKNVIVAAGTVITPKTVIPANSMVMGIPGKVVRKLTEKEQTMLREHAEGYVELMKSYK